MTAPSGTAAELHGRLPNIFYLSVDKDALRAQPAYTCLPPVHHLALTSVQSYRLVRQDSQLWSDLHRGLLTTGRLASALGFFEPKAAKRLGISSDWVSHNKLLRAYEHLQSPVYIPAEDAALREAAAAEAELQAAIEAAGEAATAAKACAAVDAAGSRGGAKRPRRKKHARPGAGGSAARPDSVGSAPDPGDGARPGMPAVQDWERQQASRYATRGVSGVRMAWGSAQEAAALWALLVAVPGAALSEVGLCWLDPAGLPPEWGFRPGDLPPMAASPDGMVRHAVPPHAATPVAGAGAAAARTMPDDGCCTAPGTPGPWAPISDAAAAEDGSEALLSRPEACSSTAPPGDVPVGASTSSHPGLPLRGPAAGPEPAVLEEVVEVKNACPFGMRWLVGAKGKSSGHFVLADRGPHELVLPMWVPQVQLQMLAAGTSSALIVSRSATRGVNIFRMQRDLAYLRCMLDVVCRFYRSHVLADRPPGRDMFWQWDRYQQLLGSTLRIARNAELCMHCPNPVVGPDGCTQDQRLFLD